MATRERSKSGALATIPPDNLLIGVPKKGRLHEQCIKLLVDGAGLEYRRPDRVDIAHCKNDPVRLPSVPVLLFAVARAHAVVVASCEHAHAPPDASLPLKVLLRIRCCRFLTNTPSPSLTLCDSTVQVTLVFLPAHDIATYVSEGNVDMGITGQDVMAETEPDCAELETVLELGFGKCKLAVQV